MAVFEQGGGAYGQGGFDDFHEGFEVAEESLGKSAAEECLEYVVVAEVAEGYAVEVVGVHELIEDVGAEHEGLGYEEGGWGFAAVLHDHSVEKGEASAFAAERSVSNSGEVAVLVESVALEYGDYALVLHATVCDDGFEDDLAVGVDVLELVPGDAFEYLGDGEEGATR